MFYVVPATTTIPDFVQTKEPDHRGKFVHVEHAKDQADALAYETGEHFNVVDIRIVYTTQTIEDAVRAFSAA